MVNDTTIKTYAYANGIAKQGAELTEAQKVQARYGAIMEATKNAQGDLGRTMDSPTNKIRIMKEQAEQIGIQFGQILIPILEKLMAVIKLLMDKFQGLSKEQQENIVKVGLVVAAIGPVILIVGKVITIIGTLSSIISAVSGAIAAAGGASAALGAVFTALTGPVGIAIAIIAGLIAVGVLLYKNWDTIKVSISGIWEWLKTSISNSVTSIKRSIFSTWESIKAVVLPIVEGIASVIKTIWDGVKTGVAFLWEVIKAIFISAWTIISSIVQTYINIVTAVISVAWQLIQVVTTTMWNAVSGVISTVWNGIVSFLNPIIQGIGNSITIQIMLDNKEIPFTPKQKLQQGDNIIGIPLGIPQVSSGAHYYISVHLRTDTGTVTIPIYNLQCMIDGRNLQGGLSAEPPHAEVVQKISYVNIRDISRLNTSTNIVFENLVNNALNQSIPHFDVGCNRVINSVNIALTKVAEETYFNSEDMDLFEMETEFIRLNGTMNFITEFISADFMVKAPTETGILFSGTLPDSSNF